MLHAEYMVAPRQIDRPLEVTSGPADREEIEVLPRRLQLDGHLVAALPAVGQSGDEQPAETVRERDHSTLSDSSSSSVPHSSAGPERSRSVRASSGAWLDPQDRPARSD